MSHHRVPTRLLAPIIQKYVDEYQTGAVLLTPWNVKLVPTTGGGIVDSQSSQSYSSVGALSFQSGITVRTIDRIMYQHQEYAAFDTADKLLTTMGLNFMWYEHPLAAFYYAPDEEVPEDFWSLVGFHPLFARDRQAVAV